MYRPPYCVCKVFLGDRLVDLPLTCQATVAQEHHGELGLSLSWQNVCLACKAALCKSDVMPPMCDPNNSGEPESAKVQGYPTCGGRALPDLEVLPPPPKKRGGRGGKEGGIEGKKESRTAHIQGASFHISYTSLGKSS